MNRRTFALLVASFLVLPSLPALAQGGPSDTVDGEVRRLDKANGKISIRHGPLPNLDMPAMTMVFRVADPTIFDKVKVGDKIRFVTEKVDGQFTVKSYEPAP
jgi:Cu/Ag efflux protein CusF